MYLPRAPAFLSILHVKSLGSPNSLLKWPRAKPPCLSILTRPLTTCIPLGLRHGQGAVVWGMGDGVRELHIWINGVYVCAPDPSSCRIEPGKQAVSWAPGQGGAGSPSAATFWDSKQSRNSKFKFSLPGLLKVCYQTYFI